MCFLLKKKAGPGTACLLRLKGVPQQTTDQELVEAVQYFGKINHAFVIKAIEEVFKESLKYCL